MPITYPMAYKPPVSTLLEAAMQFLAATPELSVSGASNRRIFKPAQCADAHPRPKP